MEIAEKSLMGGQFCKIDPPMRHASSSAALEWIWEKLRLWLFLFQAKKFDENGNPASTSSTCNNSSGSSVSFTARQLKPLSIYRHNPAFHSQHVSVNQMDEIPPLSPTALQPTTPLKCTNEQENSDRMLPAKARRKKKVSWSQCARMDLNKRSSPGWKTIIE